MSNTKNRLLLDNLGFKDRPLIVEAVQSVNRREEWYGRKTTENTNQEN